LNPQTYTNLETKRLFLKQINAEEFFKIGTELFETLDKFTSQRIFSEPNRNKTLIFSLTNKIDRQLVGFNFFKPLIARSEMECYFVLFPHYTGNGYAIESLKKAIEFVFSTMTIDTLRAYVEQDNKKGWLVVERSGMKYMGDEIDNKENKKLMKFSMNKGDFHNIYRH